MKIMTSAILLIFSVNAFAQDCGILLDGETVRLDQPGKSLENGKVQDQDGLGTCYANTTSIVLQSALPGNPDVSYLNIALTYAEKVNSRLDKAGFAYDKDGDFLIDGGNVCPAIKLMKESGGVCSRADVPLEKSLFNTDVNNFVDNARVQKQLMEKVSKYYDDVNKAFNKKSSTSGRPETSGPRPKAIPGVSPELEQKITNGINEFAEKAKSFFSDLGKGFKNFFSAIFDRGDKGKTNPNDVPVIDITKRDDPKPPAPPIPDPIPQPSPSPIVQEEPIKDSDVIETRPESVEAFTAEKFETLKNSKRPLTNKEQYQMALYELLQKRMPEYAAENCRKLEDKNGLEVLNNLAAYVQNSINNPKLDSSARALRYDLYDATYTYGEGKTKTYEFGFKANVLKAIKVDYLKLISSSPIPKSGSEAFVKALKKNLPDYVSDKEISRILSKLDPQVTGLLEQDYKRYALNDFSECAKDQSSYLRNDDGLLKDFAASPCLKGYLELGKGIQELAVGLDKRKITDINKIAEFVLNSPDKNYEKSLMMLLSPTCNDENKIKIPKNLSCRDEHISFADISQDNSIGLKKRLEQEQKKFRDNITSSIIGNKAVAVSLCTIFFKENPSYFYNNNQNCKVDRKDAFHAVSVIGYRCKAGKMDYLIQNSWGEWRDLNESHQRDEAFGKAWFSEESLVKNVYNYSLIGN